MQHTGQWGEVIEGNTAHGGHVLHRLQGPLVALPTHRGQVIEYCNTQGAMEWL